MHKAIRIAVTGPESTGKTTLVNELTNYFRAVAVPEFARQYLSDLGRKYTFDDLLFIAQQQIACEDTAAENAKIIVCDTELLVTKIWCDDKFGSCHQWILDELKHREYDIVLLCNIDLPWHPDPLREDPHRRELLMNIYRKQVHQYYDHVVEISGLGASRLEMAVTKIESVIKMKQENF